MIYLICVLVGLLAGLAVGLLLQRRAIRDLRVVVAWAYVHVFWVAIRRTLPPDLKKELEKVLRKLREHI